MTTRSSSTSSTSRRPSRRPSAAAGCRGVTAPATAVRKQADREQRLQTYAQQEQESDDQAQQIQAPGPLRRIHQHLIDALELRAKGLAGLGDTLSQTASVKDASTAAATLTAKAQLLTASDVVWDDLY